MHTHTHTIVLWLFWILSRTTRVIRYQKGKSQEGKTSLDLLEHEIVSGSGICGAICKSAPHPVTPDRKPCQHPVTQLFSGRMPFLPPNQQRQSTEGKKIEHESDPKWHHDWFSCFCSIMVITNTQTMLRSC